MKAQTLEYVDKKLKENITLFWRYCTRVDLSIKEYPTKKRSFGILMVIHLDTRSN